MTSLEQIADIAKLVGVIGAPIAIVIALIQLGMTIAQRRRDLRWRRSEMAKKVLDEWFSSEASRDALRMVEPRKRRYKTAPNLTEVIPQAYVLTALQSENSANQPQEVFIQDRFETLFYAFERTEQFLRSDLIDFEDIRHPTEYYVTHMANHKKVYRDYAKTNGYEGALLFLDHFDVWKRAPLLQHQG